MSTNTIFDYVSEGWHHALFAARHSCALMHSDCSRVIAAIAGLTSLQKVSKGRAALLIAVAVVIVLVTGLQLSFFDGGNRPKSSCPQQPQRSKSFDEGPVVLLALARKTEGLETKTALGQCVEWSPMRGGLAPLEQLQAQLECHSALISAAANEEDAALLNVAFVRRARMVLSALRGINGQCDAVHSKLQTLSRSGAAMRQPIEAVVALGGLASFETSARGGLATLSLLADLLDQSAKTGASHAASLLQEVHHLRIGFQGCVLKSVREARMLAHALPLANPGIRQVQLCKPEMLMGLERLVLAASAREKDSGVTFDAGLLLSEVSTAPVDAPFFGPLHENSLIWSSDLRGTQVPLQIAMSEKMLLASLESSSDLDRVERAKFVAIHLATHATHLTQEKQYTAAEWRYRASADVAQKHKHYRIAASSFAQLSYFLSLHGQADNALEAADEALSLGQDSLALYLQASLRLTLGELRTEEQLHEAAKQLIAVKGMLPSQELEANRMEILRKLQSWHQISQAKPLGACLSYADASEILICGLGWLAEALA